MRCHSTCAAPPPSFRKHGYPNGLCAAVILRARRRRGIPGRAAAGAAMSDCRAEAGCRIPRPDGAVSSPLRTGRDSAAREQLASYQCACTGTASAAARRLVSAHAPAPVCTCCVLPGGGGKPPGGGGGNPPGGGGYWPGGGPPGGGGKWPGGMPAGGPDGGGGYWAGGGGGIPGGGPPTSGGAAAAGTCRNKVDGQNEQGRLCVHSRMQMRNSDHDCALISG